MYVRSTAMRLSCTGALTFWVGISMVTVASPGKASTGRNVGVAVEEDESGEVSNTSEMEGAVGLTWRWLWIVITRLTPQMAKPTSRAAIPIPKIMSPAIKLRTGGMFGMIGCPVLRGGFWGL